MLLFFVTHVWLPISGYAVWCGTVLLTRSRSGLASWSVALILLMVLVLMTLQPHPSWLLCDIAFTWGRPGSYGIHNSRDMQWVWWEGFVFLLYLSQIVCMLYSLFIHSRGALVVE